METETTTTKEKTNDPEFDKASQDNYYALSDVIASTLKLARNKKATDSQRKAAQTLHDSLIISLNNYFSDIDDIESEIK